MSATQPTQPTPTDDLFPTHLLLDHRRAASWTRCRKRERAALALSALAPGQGLREPEHLGDDVSRAPAGPPGGPPF